MSPKQVVSSLRLLAAGAFVSFVFASSALAAQFTVTKVADTNDGVCDSDCSFREAIAAANAAAGDDSVVFDPTVFGTPQTITLTNGSVSMTGSQSVSITGTGTQLVTIDGANLGTLFVAAGSSATISNLKITGNTSGGSPRVQNNGTLVLSSVHLSNGANVIGIPALYNFQGNLTVTNSTFQNNTRTAISNEDGTANISSTLFIGNGTAILNLRGNMTVTDSTMTASPHTPFHNREGTASLNNVTIENNINNDLGARSAAVNNDTLGTIPAVLTITNSRISNNQLLGGSALGGGICNFGGSVTVDRTVINNNRATDDGGGIYLRGGSVNVINSTIAGNTTQDSGGGIFADGGTVNLTNATVAGNTSTGTAFGGGGGIVNSSATINSRNSIIADNVATFSTRHDISGTLVSQGYNLIENTFGGTITGIQTGNIIGQDPLLSALANNGGPTATMALNPASPAIDAGDPGNFPPVDQRGVARPQDGDLDGTSVPDIGAYERHVSTVFTVSKTADTNDGACDGDCSLREAIAASNAATTPDHAITFDPGVFGTQQTITLTAGELTIDADGTLLISGPGRDLLTIHGNNASRILFMQTGASASVERLTMTNGSAPFNNGGAIHNGLSTLTLSDVSILYSTASNGGAIKNEGGVLTIIDSLLSNNTAGTSGGAISSSDFAQFRARLSLSGVTLHGNTAMHSGGALDTSAVGTVIINRSTFQTNTVTGSSNSGGGMRSLGGLITINESVFHGNSATDGGGGIRIDGDSARLMMTKSTIRNNTAAYGGGMRLDSAISTIADSTFSFNNAIGRGAGLLTNGGTATVTGSTFHDNSANDDGGGIGNFATLTLTNSTVTNNRATDTGGGIYNGNIATVSYVTISNNQANHGGGVVNGGTFSATGMIVGDNTANTTTKDFASTLDSQGYNFIGNATGATITGTTMGNIVGQDPRLGPLRNNGGPTLTRALLPGSPAIDRGSQSNFPSTDQRGVARPKDGNRDGFPIADMGAFERDLALDNRAPFDFDGDGRTDISIFRPTGAEWWINRSSTGATFAAQFGSVGDVIAPGDYTGDGKADIAVWRPSTGDWFILRSEDSSYFSFPFGTNGDVIVPADYDGDGKTDATVFRPSLGAWFIRRSSDGGATIETFGTSSDVPVAADYDGDGKADIAIYRPSLGQWWIKRSTAGVIAITFGESTDKPVPGDYTGDGKADVAFWRPSTGQWFVLRSEDSSFYGVPFGLSTDIPAPGDYDGDGKHDPAVFRPSNGTWYVDRSTTGTLIQTFGQTGDHPVPNAFVP